MIIGQGNLLQNVLYTTTTIIPGIPPDPVFKSIAPLPISTLPLLLSREVLIVYHDHLIPILPHPHPPSSNRPP